MIKIKSPIDDKVFDDIPEPKWRQEGSTMKDSTKLIMILMPFFIDENEELVTKVNSKVSFLLNSN